MEIDINVLQMMPDEEPTGLMMCDNTCLQTCTVSCKVTCAGKTSE
ncbi:ALQxL family class IV lanthipeptide [Streptomyces sp. NPDC002659]